MTERSPVPVSFSARTLFRSINAKLALSMGGIVIVLMAALLFWFSLSLSYLKQLESDRLDLYRELNVDLRAEIFSLQDRIIEIPGLLSVDAARLLLDWARSEYGIREVVHEGRDEIVARYRSRTARRDISRTSSIRKATSCSTRKRLCPVMQTAWHSTLMMRMAGAC